MPEKLFAYNALNTIVLGGCRPNHISREDARSDGTSTAKPMDTVCLPGQPAASHAQQGAETLPAPAVTPLPRPSATATPASRSGTPGKGSGTPASLGQLSTKRKLPLVRHIPPCMLTTGTLYTILYHGRAKTVSLHSRYAHSTSTAFHRCWKWQG